MKNTKRCLDTDNKSRYKEIDSKLFDGTAVTLLQAKSVQGQSWETEVKKKVGYGKSIFVKVMSTGITVYIRNPPVLHSLSPFPEVETWAKSTLSAMRAQGENVTELVAVII